MNKDRKLKQMAEEAANKPDDDCTFTPNLYTTVKKADG